MSASGLNGSPAAAGTASVVGNQLLFSPGTDFDELDALDTSTVVISYVMQDDFGALAGGTLEITVNGENDLPTVEDVDVAADEDGATVDGNFVGDDLDDEDDGTTLTYAIVDDLGVGEGSVTNNSDGSFTFNPGTDFQDLAKDETATVSFTYEATDSQSGVSTLGTVEITITGVNDAPESQDVTGVAADEDGEPVTASFDSDDIDSDDDPSSLTYTITSAPSEGSVDNNDDGTFEFDPGDDFQDLSEGETRDVSFDYSATDSHGLVGNTAGITVTVTGVNDIPTAENVTADADEGGPIVTIAFDADDADSEDDASTLTYTIVTGPAEGIATNNGDGTFDFDPGADFQDLAVGETRDVTVTYEVTDFQNATSVSADVTITVHGANSDPVAEDVTADADEDGVAFNGAFVANDVDSDEDGSTLIFVITSTSSEGLPSTSGTPGDNTFTFDPGPDFQDLAVGETRDVTFEYEVTDGHGAVSNTATVTVTVTGVNDAPDVLDVFADADEDGDEIIGSFDADDVDSDDDGTTLTYAITSTPSGGTATNNGDGSFDFDPGMDFQELAEGETTIVTFDYTATDQHGDSNEAVASVTVTGVNDLPEIFGGDSVDLAENSPIGTLVFDGLSADDIDTTDVLTFEIVGGNDDGGFVIDPSSGVITVADDSVLDFETTESFELTVQVTDSQLASAITPQFVTINLLDVVPQFVVVNTDDSGVGSLRDAIESVNLSIEPSEVLFDIPGAGPHNIALLSPLAELNQTVVIDGTSEPDFAGTPVVGITGGTAGTLATGIRLGFDADASTVTGLSISGFDGDGISISDSGSHAIVGNWIGLDTTGAASGNRFGIRIIDSADNFIDGNVVSGNQASGVAITGIDSIGNIFVNNLIGTDSTGLTAAGNQGAGLFLKSPGTIVGLPGQGNVISGNSGHGVAISVGADGNLIQGNLIGVDLSGENAIPNASFGISIRSANNLIGGLSDFGQGNVLSGNTRHGIAIAGATATDNVIAGNLIGTNASGTAGVGNGSFGIYIKDADNNTVGGAPLLNEGNVISGNTRSGVAIVGSDNTLIEGNRIGTDITGFSAIANSSIGVSISNGSTNTLVSDNQIAGNIGTGLAIGGATTTGTQVELNLIGTNADASAALGNGTFAVLVGSPGNTIGGDISQGNVIAGSSRGVVISRAEATGNTVSGNFIGTDDVEGIDLGMGIGVQVAKDASGNTIGPDNLIANNGTGISFLANAGNMNTITQNSFVDNTTVGIALTVGAPTANDPGDSDEGPNRLLNYPELASAELVSEAVEVTFTVPTDVANATYDLTIEFYVSDALGQGSTFIESVPYLAADAGNEVTVTLSSAVAATLLPGDHISATATDADGNTSEFSAAVMIPLLLELSSPAPLMASLAGARSSLDVSADGAITPLDILMVLNELTESAANGESAVARDELLREDVNGDGLVTPADALDVINWLADHTRASIEVQNSQATSLIDSAFAEIDDDDDALLDETFLF
ncbi:MAG: Ig-like domain-containing protein [Rubripirellula sp.]